MTVYDKCFLENVLYDRDRLGNVIFSYACRYELHLEFGAVCGRCIEFASQFISVPFRSTVCIASHQSYFNFPDSLSRALTATLPYTLRFRPTFYGNRRLFSSPHETRDKFSRRLLSHLHG